MVHSVVGGIVDGRNVFNEIAGSVAGAVVGAGGTTAALSSVAFVALALTGGAVAETLVGAFGVPVSIAVSVGGINPREAVGAHAFTAVSTLPVSEAGATIRVTARTVSRAQVGAGGSSKGETSGEGGSNEKSRFHV
jgi:hypothetical protein